MNDETKKKLLFFLPADKPWARILRRGIVIAVLTFIVIILKELIIPTVPVAWVAVFSAIAATIDKMIREFQ